MDVHLPNKVCRVCGAVKFHETSTLEFPFVGSPLILSWTSTVQGFSLLVVLEIPGGSVKGTDATTALLTNESKTATLQTGS